jgi:DNA-binding NtrC family response regulator
MAAPLIGSTVAMRQLRATIERVACTDFTVLLEGESDPQQKVKGLAFR